jgi:hypothetical protein
MKQEISIHYHNHYFTEDDKKYTMIYWTSDNVRLETTEAIKARGGFEIYEGHLVYEQLAQEASRLHQMFLKWLDLEFVKDMETINARWNTIGFLPETDAKENPKKEN